MCLVLGWSLFGRSVIVATFAGLQQKSISLFPVASFLIVLLMMLVILSLCFQGLFGTVNAVSVSNGNSVMSWSDRICSPLRAYCIVHDMGAAARFRCLYPNPPFLAGNVAIRDACIRRLSLGCVYDNFQEEKSFVVLMVSRKGIAHFVGSVGGGSPSSCWLYVLSISVLVRWVIMGCARSINGWNLYRLLVST